MANARRFGLVTTFNLLTIGLILVTAVGIAWFVIRATSARYHEDLLHHGTSVAAMIAENAEYALYVADREALSQMADSLAVDRDVAYVAFRNAEQTILASRIMDPDLDIPARLDRRVPLAGSPILFAWSRQGRSGKGYLDILAPVVSRTARAGDDLFFEMRHDADQPGTIGYVQLGLGHQALDTRIREFLLSTVLFTSILVLVGVGLTVVMTRRIASPIQYLARVARGISEGKLDQRIGLTSHDEINRLADAFNAMIERLRDSREQVRAYQHTLEAKVEERTSELQRATEQAYALAEQAKEADRTKSRFLASVSHEIRTPLTGVLGMIDLLLDTTLTARQRHFAEAAQQSGEALLSLINDILDLSKIEAGKLELERMEFDVRRTVQDVVELLARPAQRKGLELTGVIEPDVPTRLRGDPHRLRQILTNLVGNAVKFTEAGAVTIHVSVPEVGEHEVELRCEVRDTGIGISEDAQGRLFESFSQADGSTTRKFGGTGLGLAICKQLVERMGGEIGVQSRPGRGSTFWFTVRFEAALERSPVGAPGAPLAPRAADPLAESNRRSCRGVVLVAEDHAVNREVTVSMLQDLGCRVDTAATGAETLDAASRVGYDAIFMDCQMPNMDGLEATKAIRAREAFERPVASGAPRRVPIIALTANVMETDLRKCLAAGMDDYVIKPFHKGQLLAMLDKWVPERGAVSVEDGPGGTGQTDDRPENHVPDDLVTESERGTVLDDVTSKVVHDLRTLLIGINRTLSLFKQDRGDQGPQAEHVLGELVTASDLVLGTIDDRLDVYQGGYGRFRLQEGAVSLGQTVSEAIALLERDAREKELRIAVEGAAGAPSIAGDKRRLGRVFVNLLDHAIKYSPRGGSIRIRFEADHQGSPWVACFVEDDGPGLAPRQIADLMQPKREALHDVLERGQGIGLEFCRLVIEAHGGTMWTEDREGRGAVFGFRLPIVRAADAD